jgi:hypothetical protein
LTVTKENEKKDETIEHLEELLLKRNKVSV